MAGIEEQPNTDDHPPTPQRPVSSLLSHFENLAHRRAPSAAAASPRTSAAHLNAEPSDELQRSTRASLDSSRPQLPRTLTDGRPEKPHSKSGHFWNRGLSEKRHDRPIHMSFNHSSPQLPPTLTVQSPQSPPRGQDQDGFWSEQDEARKARSPGNRPQEPVFNSPAPPRPLSPVPKFNPSNFGGGTESPLSLRPNLTGSPADRKLKSASLPPPANRASKPKIPAKPAQFSQADPNALAPQSERASPDSSVSPFNTPPSSPEKSPPKPVSTGRMNSRPPPPARPTTEPPSRRSFDDRSPAPTASARQDAREMGLPSSRPVPEPSRASKPLMVQIPPTPLPPPQTASTAPPIPAPRLRTSDSPHNRPGLPPRPPETPRRVGVSPVRESPQLVRSPSQMAPGARPVPSIPRIGDSTAPKPINRQSSLSSETRLSSSLPERRIARVDTEEEEQIEEPAITPTDYPDASKANRRPPYLKGGPKEIPTRYDTRLLAVCGKYVCTTGYLTKVWDLTTGEQVMSLSHGETVKSLSLAFKPGTGLEDEGHRIWLGTSAGDIHEVDIPSQSIVATRSYPSRREVIQILRHGKEMWTFDDEGRLLIWQPDESGTPNLQYSYQNAPERVARGHTFSMAVGDKLWLAAGKDIHIYRPNARDNVSFKVFKRAIGLQHSGDVTSGAYSTRDGGRVYLGQADGKVTVYSATDFKCLAVVNVSVYKINCLEFVGDYLWAAYKTGMIYVYDVTTNPWTVKKDWRAHDSPVSGFVFDTSSVWTMNRLQVTSLGDDNCIRLWDGMLEEDWLDARMQQRDVDFCSFREIKAVVLTWNAGAVTPGSPSVKTSDFIQQAVTPEDPPEILIFGFQELVDLENKKITAKSLLMSSKKKENGEKEHMSRQYRVWIDHLTRTLQECMPLEESYVLLHTANMVGLFTCIFVKHKERHNIKNTSATEIKRGMGGLHGNKGALIFRFVLDDSSLCFVNCHLAAGQTQTAHRNNDIAAILEAECLPVESNMTRRIDQFASGGDGTMIMDHEVCILNGDLNYRIDSIPRNVIIDAVRQNNLAKLLDRDQLLASRRKNPGFRLRSFTEGPINFAPTYKYDVGTDQYDSSEKKRSPAWCDRVLYGGLGRVKQLDYRRLEVRASDHRPVSAAFKIRIKTVLPQERGSVWEECNKDFEEEKRRLASEASIEYLITVLGTDPRHARELIMKPQ